MNKIPLKIIMFQATMYYKTARKEVVTEGLQVLWIEVWMDWVRDQQFIFVRSVDALMKIGRDFSFA
eukprot:773378-Ditylum_brightwellii.AAC.1